MNVVGEESLRFAFIPLWSSPLLKFCHSKNEQKRRQKEREREERRKGKTGPEPEKKISAAASEAELTPNVGYLPSI